MRSKHSNGFTTVELVVAMGLVLVLLAVAVPSFSDSRLTSQLRSSSLELIASTNLARSEAIKRNGVVTLCVSANGTTCGSGGWEQGWIVTSGGEVIYRAQPIASGFHIKAAGNATSFTFQATGVDSTAGSFKICRATPSIGRQDRLVTVDAAGRAVITKTATGSC